jgi:hypothetical protein
MKKIILSLAVICFLIVTNNDCTQEDFPYTPKYEVAKAKSKPGLINKALTVLFFGPDLACAKLTQYFDIPSKQIFNHSFFSGYFFNFIRLGELGENIFERGSKKLGLSQKHTPWVGAATWNLLPVMQLSQDMYPYPLLFKANIKTYLMAYGAYGLGALSGTLWRNKILTPAWEHAVKPTAFYVAHLARKTMHAVVA